MKGTEAITDRFPGEIKQDLPNSHRFGQMIADLADPLGLIPYDLKGQGPKEPLASCLSEGRHTIYLFDDDSADNVLDAYAELLIETFSERELREGTFTAVGQVHRPPSEEGNSKFPHHVGHYWPDYDPELTRRDPMPRTFLQYVFVGKGRAEIAGEVYLSVEMIAEGILHLTRMAEGGKIIHRCVESYVIARSVTISHDNSWCIEHSEVDPQDTDHVVVTAALAEHGIVSIKV